MSDALNALKAKVDDMDWLWLRCALYGGLLSSVGVTLGWFLWVAVEVLFQPGHGKDVWLAALIGAAVGLLVEWLRDYREVARREAGLVPQEEEEQSEKKEKGEAGGEQRPPDYAGAARVGAFVLGALGVVCEHLAADLIRDILRPFVTSLAMMFPVGALFTLALRGREWRGGYAPPALLARVLGGALLGIAAAALVYSVCLLSGTARHGIFEGLAGWWVLVGIGFTLAGVNTENPFSPAGGFLLATLLVLALCKWSSPQTLTGSLRQSNGGASVYQIVEAVVQTAAKNALEEPGLPQQYWLAAEEQVRKDQSASPVAQALPGAKWTLGLCRWIGCSPRRAAPAAITPTPAPPQDVLGLSVEAYLAEHPQEARHLTMTPATPEVPPGGSLAAAPPTPPTGEDGPQSDQDPRQRLCTDLQMANGAGLLRSWLVMLCFSLGLGVAGPMEEHYRPEEYDGSKTRANDWALTALSLTLIVLAVLLTRFPPAWLNK